MRRALAVLLPAVCLLVGIVTGWIISAALTPGYRVPSKAGLQRLCAPNPGVGLRQWKYIILHHSGGDGDAASIDRYHREDRDWENGLGYGFLIGNGTLSGDGEIEVSGRWRRQIDGAHCKAAGMNEKAIGICFVGNFEHGGGPSRQQLHSGIALIRYLSARFSIPPENILGHGEVSGANTKCPGRHFPLHLMRAAAGAPDKAAAPQRHGGFVRVGRLLDRREHRR